ncbi:hypothetical protein R1sor_018656 [Riccia sorocarpa]|uniref:Uncharacterized protein n=1 Tax=Riccia sorocarpa TaxID=122646 RepID=A0ABD3IDM0_9MARC
MVTLNNIFEYLDQLEVDELYDIYQKLIEDTLYYMDADAEAVIDDVEYRLLTCGDEVIRMAIMEGYPRRLRSNDTTTSSTSRLVVYTLTMPGYNRVARLDRKTLDELYSLRDEYEGLACDEPELFTVDSRYTEILLEIETAIMTRFEANWRTLWEVDEEPPTGPNWDGGPNIPTTDGPI